MIVVDVDGLEVDVDGFEIDVDGFEVELDETVVYGVETGAGRAGLAVGTNVEVEGAIIVD